MRGRKTIGRSSFVGPMVAVIALGLLQCGGRASGTDDSASSHGQSGGGSSSGSSSGASSGGGAPSDSGGGGGGAPSDSGGPSVLYCTCPAGQLCCAQRTSAVPFLSCASLDDCANEGAIECVSLADCPPGQVCCGPAASTDPLGTRCMTACTAAGYLSRTLCITLVDCPDLDYTCPSARVTDPSGGLYKTCRPAVVDAGLPVDSASE